MGHTASTRGGSASSRPVGKRADGAPAAQRKHHRFRPHGANLLGRFQIVRAREQRAPQQPLGLLLVGRHHRGPRSMPSRSASPLACSSVFTFLLPGHGDQLAVEGRRHAGRQAAAQQQPRGARPAFAHGRFHARHFLRSSVRSRLVEVDGEAVRVRDGEVRADLVLHRHHAERESAPDQVALQPLAGIAAGDQHRRRVAAERVNHRGRVDAASARRFAAGIDVGAVLESQAVDADDVVEAGLMVRVTINPIL